MNEVIKSCHNCAATSGFMCQQCYDMSCWKFDAERNEEYLRERAEWKTELEGEIRADEREKVLDEVRNALLEKADYMETEEGFYGKVVTEKEIEEVIKNL